MEGKKKCICCGEWKPLSDFYRHNKMKDGHLNKCIECVKIYERKKHEEEKRKRQMKVKFVKYNENARIPEKAHNDDFCYDVYAVDEKEVARDVWRYGLGFGLQIVRGLENIESVSLNDGLGERPTFVENTNIHFGFSPMSLAIDFRPRSSVWKTGMVLSNSVGTIDEGYTGEISAVFYHVNKDLPRYRVGDKIGQIKLGMALPMDFVEVEKLDETERGSDSYGSTGK